MRILFLFVSILCFKVGNAQVSNPKIWFLGYQAPEKDTSSLDTGVYKDYGTTILNFRSIPINKTRNGYSLSLGGCYTHIFNDLDSLILYTNGSKIFNGKHRLIDGGDKLCFGSDWATSPYSKSYFGNFYISVYPNPLLILNNPYNFSQYYLISTKVTPDNINYKLVYSLIDMSLNSNNGKVIEKEVVIKDGDFTPAISACKHGNGRDWWLIARKFSKNNFTLMLLNSDGIRVISEEQESNWDLYERIVTKGNSTNRFSWGGDLFASFTHLGVELFDFDRCTGILSKRREFLLPSNDSFLTTGVGCFSPNDKFIYTNNGGYLYQIELKNNKVRLIGIWDKFADTPTNANFGFYTTFGSSQLASDGKIYFNTSEVSRYLHVINNPNDTGILCNFKQRSIKLLTWNAGLPSFPNYELGAIADKCGESSINERTMENIEVYPNPARNRCFIRNNDIMKPIHYIIHDLLGKELLRGHYIDEIDLSSLSNGHYFITFIDDRYTQIVKRIEIRK